MSGSGMINGPLYIDKVKKSFLGAWAPFTRGGANLLQGQQRLTQGALGFTPLPLPFGADYVGAIGMRWGLSRGFLLVASGRDT